MQEPERKLIKRFKQENLYWVSSTQTDLLFNYWFYVRMMIHNSRMPAIITSIKIILWKTACYPNCTYLLKGNKIVCMKPTLKIKFGFQNSGLEKGLLKQHQRLLCKSFTLKCLAQFYCCLNKVCRPVSSFQLTSNQIK